MSELMKLLATNLSLEDGLAAPVVEEVLPVNAVDIEATVESIQSLESLAVLMMESKAGYSTRELAIHHEAVNAHCRIAKVEPPRQSTMESISTHGNAKETELVLESLLDHIDDLREKVMSDSSKNLDYTLSTESIKETVFSFFSKVWEHVKAYLRLVSNWFNSFFTGNRRLIAQTNETLRKAGLPVNATAEQIFQALMKEYTGHHEFDAFVHVVDKMLKVSPKDLVQDKHIHELLEEAETIAHNLNTKGFGRLSTQYVWSADKDTAGRLSDKLHVCDELVKLLRNSLSLTMADYDNDKAAKKFRDYHRVNYTKLHQRKSELFGAVRQLDSALLLAADVNKYIHVDQDNKHTLTDEFDSVVKAVDKSYTTCDALYKDLFDNQEEDNNPILGADLEKLHSDITEVVSIIQSLRGPDDIANKLQKEKFFSNGHIWKLHTLRTNLNYTAQMLSRFTKALSAASVQLGRHYKMRASLVALLAKIKKASEDVSKI